MPRRQRDWVSEQYKRHQQEQLKRPLVILFPRTDQSSPIPNIVQQSAPESLRNESNMASDVQQQPGRYRDSQRSDHRRLSDSINIKQPSEQLEPIEARDRDDSSRIVLCVDYGTTYTGVAWALSHDRGYVESHLFLHLANYRQSQRASRYKSYPDLGRSR